MSAQLGGNGLPKPGEWPASSSEGSLPGGRAYSFFCGGMESFDYVVQMPENGEFMFGGAADMVRDNASLLSMDDSVPPAHAATAYLNGALPDYFGYDTWGAERTDFPKSSDPRVAEGRTKAVWTGIEGFSSDGLPFVGRLPTEAISSESEDGQKGSEWVSASFSGEGMCFAWLSGKALSTMLLAEESGDDPRDALEWFPESFTITPERLNETKFTPA